MKVRVLKLRDHGVPVDLPQMAFDSPTSAYAEEGLLDYGRPDTTGAKCLMLRRLNSSPDKGVLIKLYQPEIVAVTGGAMRVRGFEACSVGMRTGGFLQEWHIFMR